MASLKLLLRDGLRLTRNGSFRSSHGGTPKSSKLNKLCIETHCDGGSIFLRNPQMKLLHQKQQVSGATTTGKKNHVTTQLLLLVIVAYCLLLVTGCLLVAGCRLLVAGFWLFLACSLFLVACRLPLAACCLLPAALLPGGGGCWIVAVNHKGNRSITEDRDTGDLGTHRETEGKTNLDDKFSAAAKSSQERNSQRETEGRQK